MRRDRIKIKLLVGMLFSITILIYGCGANEQDQERVIAVEITEVERGSISNQVTVTSQLQSKENAMVVTKTPGLTVTNVNVKLGDSVKEGDMLFELDKSLVRQQVEQAKVSYDISKENYNKQKNLLENQQRNMEELQTVYNNRSLSMFDADEAGIPDSSEATIASARAQVDQSRMAYANSLRQLEELNYYAPIDGVVSQINVFENQIALNQQPAVVITNTVKLKSNIFVSEEILNEIRLNDQVKIVIDDEIKYGEVALINPVADPITNLYLIEIDIDNSNNELRVGKFNKVMLERARREDALIISKDALLFEGENTYVFVEEKDIVYKRKVTYGIQEGSMVEIVNGVTEGERIVVRGQQYLNDEMQVRVVRGVDNESI